MPNLEAVTVVAHRPDHWSANNSLCCARYQILAEAEPALLCQVLNLFAMQYLVPSQVSAVQRDGLLSIDVQVDKLSWHRAQVMGEKMRNLVDVCSVQLDEIDRHEAAQTHVALAAG